MDSWARPPGPRSRPWPAASPHSPGGQKTAPKREGRRRDRALDGRRHGPYRDLRPKRHTPFAAGLKAKDVLAPSRRSTPRSTTSSSPRGWKDRRVMDRGTLIRTHGRGPRLDPALAAPVPLAHRLRPAAEWRPRISGPGSRTLGPKNPAVPAFIDIGQRSRATARPGAQGVSDRRLPGHRVRPVPRRPAGRGRGRPAAGARRRAVSHAGAKLLEEAPGRRSRSTTRQRLPAESLVRSLEDADRLLKSPRRRRSTCRSSRRSVRRLQHRPVRPGLPAGAAAGRGRRPVHRGDHRVHPVLRLGHPRQRPYRAAAIKKQIDAPDRPAHPRPRERGLLDRTLIVLASEFSRDA